MGYGKRIDTLCAHLTEATVFADVGCDHGYCTEYMLKNGLCRRAIFSDISRGSLAKAEKLLAPFVRAGKATPVLGNGFYGVPKDVDEVLIAGMGGSEIIAILSDEKYGFLPQRFVFQPMHDGEKLRRYILGRGGVIERDYTFEDGKFYEVLVGGALRAGAEIPAAYTQAEYEFGRENLIRMPQAFVKRIKKRIDDIGKYLAQSSLREDSREELLRRRERLEGVLKGEIK